MDPRWTHQRTSSHYSTQHYCSKQHHQNFIKHLYLSSLETAWPMAPTTRAAKTAALADQKREIQTPSLPLEIWHLIFLQNTHPKHLWTIGRQVCSTWRSKIPKVIAKKYLEDPNMTQIHSDSETTTEVENLTCLMGSKLIFSHYDSSDKTRAVFKQCSKEPKGGHEHSVLLLARKRRKTKAGASMIFTLMANSAKGNVLCVLGVRRAGDAICRLIRLGSSGRLMTLSFLA